MAEKRREKVSRYNLSGGGEDTYSSQAAQNPLTSRRLVGLVPSPSGLLGRQAAPALFYASQDPNFTNPILQFIPFVFNNAGTFVRTLYVRLATLPGLYSLIDDGFGGKIWKKMPVQSADLAPASLPNDLAYAQIGNNLQITDGVGSFLYDAVSDLLVPTGLPIPSGSNSPSCDGSAAGTLSFTKRYYWMTFADYSGNRNHESSSSAISPAVGPAVNKKIAVYPTNGNLTLPTGTNLNVIGNATGFLAYKDYLTQYPLSLKLYIRGSGGVRPYDLGAVASITSDTLLTLSTPVPAAIAGSAGVQYLLAPARATNWNVYASESENSKVGLFLASNPISFTRPGIMTLQSGSRVVTGVGTDFRSQDVGANLFATTALVGVIASVESPTQLTLSAASPFTGGTAWTTELFTYFDQSPFLGTLGSKFLQISRPVRNDPPPISSILEKHKYRLWRRRDSRPNFFNFTANEEVTATNNGSPYESVPGADVNTISDIINEVSYPDQSNEIRAMISHADALYMFSESQGLPLFGETIDDFALSQVTAFNVGIAGRKAGVSTPHGLAFMSYDRKVYLFPTSNYPWAYIPKDVNVTEQLMEIGKPMRTKFAQIPVGNLSNVQLIFYNFMSRDWLIVAFTDTANVIHNWVFDFATKSWFELATGYPALSVYETSTGNKVLLGGGNDAFIYVIDDQTGTYTSTAALPQGIFRPALIDFGDPDSKHVFRYIEYELTNPDLSKDVTLNYWLDPQDVDNPGVPKTLLMAPVKGANLFRGFPKGGGLCQRLLIEMNIASTVTAGAIRGVKLVADKASSLSN